MKVYTQGTFDLFHIGHLNLLKRCRQLSGGNGEVIVSLLSDEAIETYKKHEPIIPFEDRAAILESIKYVDEVFEGDNRSTEEELRLIRPDLIVVGSDWASKDLSFQYKMNKEFINSKLVYVPYTERESTTKIKERIKND